MATIVDSLLITLGLDTSGVDKGMAQANQKMQAGLRRFASFIAPIAGALGAMGFAKLISDYTSAADALGKFSKKIRENMVDVQGWTDAIDAAGFDSGAFQGTLTGLDKKLRDIGRRGMSGSYELRALGVSARDANGQIKTSTEILDELARVADKMNPERFRRLAEKLGVDAETIRFLQTGSKEVGVLVDKYKDLAYTKEDAEISRQYNISMGDLGKTFKAFAAIGMRIVVPMLKFLADKFAFIINFLRKHEPFVKGFFIALAAVILYTLLPAITAVAGAMWTIIAPLLPIIALIGILALLFDDFWTYVQGGESALSDFWSVFGTGEEISKALAEAWENLKIIGIALWDGVKKAAETLFGYFKPALNALWGVFKNALGLIKAIFIGDFKAIFSAIEKLLNSIGQFIISVFIGTFNLVVDIISGLIDALAPVFKAAFQDLYDFFADIFTGIGDFFAGILDSILNSVSSFIKAIISKIPDFLLPDSVIAWAKEADKTVAEVGGNMARVAGATAPGAIGNAAQAVPVGATAAGTVDNSSETNVTVGKIDIIAPNNDPGAIAAATGNELNKLTNAGNRGVRQ